MTGTIVMASPDFYEVAYTINPWMKPDEWARDGAVALDRAKAQWGALARTLTDAGYRVETVPGCPGLPDLVFPANAAVVLDGRALLARFRYPERRGEEACFLSFFEELKTRGLLTEIRQMPVGLFQEGARELFWAACGPRSAPESVAYIRSFFGREVVGLELATPRFYHLDTCFCVLSGGDVMYYPPALTPESLALVEDRVPPDKRIIAREDEAAAFSLNAVNIGRDLFMAPPPARLRGLLEERGYRCRPLDLSAFVLSGGGAFCMTLRLDLASRAGRRGAAE
jgi:N-dimethylarginine dimethylaminohydrolase